FAIGRKLFGKAAGVASAAAYAVLSAGASVLGMWAHATHFVVLFALGGPWLVLEDRGIRWVVGSGLLFGVAFVMKQPGICLAGAGAWILVDRRRWRDLAIFGAAALLHFGITCLLLWRAGVFGQFWFWVFRYGREYVSLMHWSAAPGALWAAVLAIF